MANASLVQSSKEHKIITNFVRQIHVVRLKLLQIMAPVLIANLEPSLIALKNYASYKNNVAIEKLDLRMDNVNNAQTILGQEMKVIVYQMNVMRIAY